MFFEVRLFEFAGKLGAGPNDERCIFLVVLAGDPSA